VALDHHDQQLKKNKIPSIFFIFFFFVPLNICPIVKIFPDAAKNKLLNNSSYNEKTKPYRQHMTLSHQLVSNIIMVEILVQQN
jgi:hypothetical protein